MSYDILTSSTPIDFIPLTNRREDKYSEFLGVDVTTLTGNILDLGTGRQKLETLGDLKRLTLHTEELDSNEGVVVADGVSLPFRSNYFDNILCLWSIPHYLRGNDRSKIKANSIQRMLSELYRTLVEGGSSYIYPVTEHEVELFELYLHQFQVSSERRTVGSYRVKLTKLPIQ